MAVSPVLSIGATPIPTPHSTHLQTSSRHHPKATKLPLLSSSSHQDPIFRLLGSCHSARELPAVHARVVKWHRRRKSRHLFGLLRLCTRLGAVAYAEEIFESIDHPDVYLYTAFIEGRIAARFHLDALRVFARMLEEHIQPDSFAFPLVLQACALEMALEEGRQVHGQALKCGSDLERTVRMRLVEFYSRCGEFRDARKVFGGMPEKDAVAATVIISGLCDRGLTEDAYGMFKLTEERDVVCWTAMIDGFARNGQPNDALRLFREMQRENVRPNEFTVVCVLSACSQLGALELGRWVHSYTGSCGIELNNYVRSALIDMYVTCGSLDEASNVFDAMPGQYVVAYNSMIRGFALNGRTHEAVELYRQMIREGVKPSEITFVSVLNACSHGGMVDLGFEIFNDMSKKHGIEPVMEHYGCMADLLGRVGRVQDAYDFVKNMKEEPDPIIWVSLLGACRLHGNLALAEEVARILIGMGAADAATYILLANVYASFGKWEEAARIRSEMKMKGIQKEPGCSAIEVDSEIHEFLLGDVRHPKREAIYGKLKEMGELVRLEGYSPEKDVVLQDIDDDGKEWALAIHSERLAICYGLISTEPGTTIRVTKNLRVCNDCHSMIKLIAKVTRRKIVVRDRKRFHHFEDGTCSCGDFW